jgi:hypothetical protein
MTLAIALFTPDRLTLFSFSVTRFSWLILALSLALAGLALDMFLSPGPVGLIALWPAVWGLAIASAVMFQEVLNYEKRT